MNNEKEKLLKLQQEKEQSDKRLLVSEIVLGAITTISFLIILSASLYAIHKLKFYVFPIIMIVIGCVILLTGVFFCLYIEQKTGYYVCKKCNHKYIPTFKQVSFSMHVGRIRYMKCPHCNKRSWQKKTLKQ